MPAFAAEIAPAFAAESLRNRPRIVHGGGTPWDTAFAQELRRLQPSAFMPVVDSVYVPSFRTGVHMMRDTAIVVASWDECVRPGSALFTWWATNIEYKFVPASRFGGGWKFAGHGLVQLADGQCQIGVHRGPGRGLLIPPGG